MIFHRRLLGEYVRQVLREVSRSVGFHEGVDSLHGLQIRIQLLQTLFPQYLRKLSKTGIPRRDGQSCPNPQKRPTPRVASPSPDHLNQTLYILRHIHLSHSAQSTFVPFVIYTNPIISLRYRNRDFMLCPSSLPFLIGFHPLDPGCSGLLTAVPGPILS